MIRSFVPTEEFVKVIGRTIMLDDCRLLCASASGIEFEYTGSRLMVTFLGDSSTSCENNILKWRDIPRVQVMVDGLVMLDTSIKSEKESYVVYGEDLSTPVAKHVVRILKLSEPRMSSVAVGEIVIDAEADAVPTSNKRKYVEFIGDSITCGYGVDTDNELCPFSTCTENATKAYAYLAANELEVDYSLVSYSGHGLVSGWTPDANIPKKEELLQPYYGITAYSYNNFRGTSPQDKAWDFARKPDVIVINLGTNDFSYTQDDPKKIAEYEECYLDFLKVVREKNPDAHIICSLGVMGDDLYPAVERIALTHTVNTGDSNISTLHFMPQDAENDGLVADYHPSAITQKKAAQAMADELKKWL